MIIIKSELNDQLIKTEIVAQYMIENLHKKEKFLKEFMMKIVEKNHENS